MVFDYHDDILLLDSESDPDAIHFYQVKTKDPGHWTLTDLLKRKKGSSGPLLSPLGKLFHNKLIFPDETRSLNFISNARFRLSLRGAEGDASLSKTSILASEILNDDLDKMAAQLKDEHGLPEVPSFGDLVFFIASDLSLGDHETHTKGKLNEFLEDLFTNRKFQLSTIYRAISDEIKRKNDYEKRLSTFSELIDKKSIGRSQFQKMLDGLGVKTDLDEAWNTLETRLHSEAYPLPELLGIKRQWKRYEIDRMDATNLTTQQFQTVIQSFVSSAQSDLTLSALVETGYQSCSQEPSFSRTFPNASYVKAAILMEYYEQLELSEANSKS